MTPERLKHLASRAAQGEMDKGEQRELVMISQAVYLLAADFASKLSEHSKFTHTRRALLSRSNELQALAVACTMEPVREKCKTCGGSGKIQVCTGSMASNEWHDETCFDCRGTGYAKEQV